MSLSPDLSNECLFLHFSHFVCIKMNAVKKFGNLTLRKVRSKETAEEIYSRPNLKSSATPFASEDFDLKKGELLKLYQNMKDIHKCLQKLSVSHLLGKWIANQYWGTAINASPITLQSVTSFFKEEHSPENEEDDLIKIKTSTSLLIQTFFVCATLTTFG